MRTTSHSDTNTSSRNAPTSSLAWKRFRKEKSPSRDTDKAAHVPLIVLDAEGTVKHMTRAAKRLLEYAPSDTFDRCFFTHVHGRNLYRTMQDLAHMVCHRKRQASWLLRLRTGTGRWRWFKAEVRSLLNEPESEIHIGVQPL